MSFGRCQQIRLRRPCVAATVIAALIVGVADRAAAEPPRFFAEAEPTQVGVGEPFVYHVTLSLGDEQVQEYRAPDFRNLKVLSAPRGPNRSTQMQIGAGGTFVQNSFTWRYELLAADKGAVSIGPARIRIQGQEIRSNVVKVTVASPNRAGGGTPGRSPSAAQQGFGAPDPFDDPPIRQSSQGGDGASFIRLVVDKQKVFVGEPISARWLLYLATPQDHYETVVEPRTEGFWSEDVATPQGRSGNFALTQEIVGGRPYQVGTIARKALFALEPGTLRITPLEGRISRTDFFGMSARSQRLRAEPVTIEVAPLPRAGQPPGFPASNVGQFSFSLRADRTSVTVGEPITLTYEVKGRGNLRKVVLPQVPKLPGWKVYEPRLNTSIDPSDGTSGTKTAEVLLLAEQPGSTKLPRVALDYFDPEARRYARAETDEVALTATASADAPVGAATSPAGSAPVGGAPVAAASGAAAAVPATAENVLGGDIRPIHARAGVSRDIGATLYRSRIFLPLVFAPPLLFGLTFVSLGVVGRLSRDSEPRRRRLARRRLRARLALAESHGKRNDIGAFFTEIDRVLREALVARPGPSLRGLSLDELLPALRAGGFTDEQASAVVTELERCHLARFAPSSAATGGHDLSAVLDRVSALIDTVERAPLDQSTSAGIARA